MKLAQLRDLGRGILVLIGAYLAFTGEVTIGAGLAAFVGLMTVQGAFTRFCILDIIFKALGAKE